MNITPEQAATLAANYVEPNEMPDCPDAVELWESSYDLAQTVAGMEWQWGVELHYAFDGKRRVAWWGEESSARASLAHPENRNRNPRLVRRLVGPVEVTE